MKSKKTADQAEAEKKSLDETIEKSLQQKEPSFADLLTDPEVFQTALNAILETVENIGDIAPQIELSSRANLAKSFIVFNAETGRFDFDNAAFENAWKYLTKD